MVFLFLRILSVHTHIFALIFIGYIRKDWPLRELGPLIQHFYVLLVPLII